MSLIRRNQSTSLPAFPSGQQALNRTFSEGLGRVFDALEGLGYWNPPVEIYETDDHLAFIAELPGFDKDQINITVENGQLILSGERTVDENRTYHRNERWYGKFERAFQLPSSVDPDKVEGNLRSGILTITIPKREDARPRQIPVSAQ